MVDRLDWDESFRVGVNDLDRDHQALFHSVNAFLQSLHAGCSVDAALQMYDDLFDQVRRHFYNEERYLAEINYRDLSTHRREHETLLAELRAGRDRVAAIEQANQLDDLVGFLQFWMVRHLTREDKAFADFVAARNGLRN